MAPVLVTTRLVDQVKQYILQFAPQNVAINGDMRMSSGEPRSKFRAQVPGSTDRFTAFEDRKGSSISMHDHIHHDIYT